MSRKVNLSQKQTHFRMWKSGKNWLYAAAALVSIGTIATAGAIASDASTIQINYTAPSGAANQPVYAYWWGLPSNPSSPGDAGTQLSTTDGTHYSLTMPDFSGGIGSGAGLILINTPNWNGTKLISGGQMNLAPADSEIVDVDSSGNPTTTTFNEPTITAPSNLKGTVNTPIDLTATVNNPDKLTVTTGLQVSVNGKAVSDPSTYTPTANGSYAVTYSYGYKLPNGTDGTATQSATLLVGTLFAPADKTVQLTAGESATSFTPETVTDITGGATTVSVEDANGSKIAPQTNGTYALVSGTYNIVYTGVNTAPGSVTQKLTVKQAPVTINVHYYNPAGYTGWNFWKWGDGNGTGATFTGTSTAADGTVWDDGSLTYDTSGTDGNFTAPAFSSVNFIVRQSVSGNDWAAQTQNLSVALNADGTPASKDVYVVAGDNSHIYTDETSAMAAYKKAQEIVNMDWKTFDAQYGYTGTLGAIYSPASTEFKVWSPTTDVTGVAKVQLVDYGLTTDSDADLTLKPVRVIDMTQGDVASSDPTQNTVGLWTTTVQGDMKNHVYTYRVTYTDGTTKETQDPYSTAVIVNGQKSVVVDPADTIPAGFSAAQGAAATWRVSDPTKAVIQELNVRDFTIDTATSGVSATNAGKFLGVVQSGTTDPNTGGATGIDYLKKLGVNYVQIMPSADFASVDETGVGNQQNWGYDPENYNVPEGSYSTNPANPLSRITEMKQMIQGLHNAGIGVIMDVVYPHQANQSTSPFQIMAPNYYFRLSNGSGCGNDTASEREMYSDYIVNSVLQWVKNYDVDGFRFDQMMQIDTTTMNEIRTKLNAIDPNIILYGEGWNGSSTALPTNEMSDQDNIQQIPGIGVFNDIARDAIKGSDVYSQTNPKTGFVNEATTNNVFTDPEAAVANVITGTHTSSDGKAISALTPSQLVNFVEVHDNATLNDLLWKENPTDSQATHNLRVNLANTINLLSEGVPIMETGQEFDRSKVPGSNGQNATQDQFNAAANSYNTGDAANEINWDLASQNASMVDFIQQVINFRKAHPSFELNSYSDISKDVAVTNAAQGSGVITYEVKEGTDTYLVVYNASGKTLQLGTGAATMSDLNTYQSTDFSNAQVEASDAVNLKAGQNVGQASLSLSDLSATIIHLASSSQTSPGTPTQPTPGKPATKAINLYRVYNPNTGEHLYTTSTFERDSLVRLGWKNEGIAYKVSSTATGNQAVYRLYNKNNGKHFYTTSSYEKNQLVKAGWYYENIAWYAPTQGTKVYRAYNPNNGEHLYTTSAYEVSSITKVGWKAEGIAWYSLN